MVAHNRLKWMIVDNASSVKILFGATFNKMIIDHELTPSPSLYMVSSMIASSLKGNINLAVEIGEPSK